MALLFVVVSPCLMMKPKFLTMVSEGTTAQAPQRPPLPLSVWLQCCPGNRPKIAQGLGYFGGLAEILGLRILWILGDMGLSIGDPIPRVYWFIEFYSILFPHENYRNCQEITNDLTQPDTDQLRSGLSLWRRFGGFSRAASPKTYWASLLMEIYFRAKRFECKRSASASGRQQGKTMKDPGWGPLNPWRSTDPKNQSLGDLSWLLSILEYVKPYLILGWMPVSWCCLWRLQWLQVHQVLAVEQIRDPFRELVFKESLCLDKCEWWLASIPAVKTSADSPKTWLPSIYRGFCIATSDCQMVFWLVQIDSKKLSLQWSQQSCFQG